MTRWLAEHALGCRYASLPRPARRIALHCIVDWYAVTLAAIGDPALAPLVADAREQGGPAEATAAGLEGRVGVYPAALVNGTTAHLLDYDDVNLAIPGHPTAVVYSALLPLAETLGADGQALMSAFVAGYETACRVGRWLGAAHYEQGYHATATVGVVGAAAACAHLMGLDVARTGCALGLAATQAGGLKAMFGTMGKPLHAGLAARNGLMAARLAARSYDGGHAALDAAQGYARVLSPAPDPAAALAEPPDGLHLHGRLFKYHASCYGTHAAIESARLLREEGVDPGGIATVQVLAHPASRNMCNIPSPRTAAEARFSLRLNVAFALLGIDTAGIAAYTDARLNNPRVTALRDRIEISFTDQVRTMEAEVAVELPGGRTHRARVDAGRPQADIGLEESRLRGKFLALAGPVLGAGGAQALLERLFTLPDLAALDDLARPLAAPARRG